jgi:SHS2 domain-containing protein
MNPAMIVAVLMGLGTLFVAMRQARGRLREAEETVARANSRRKAQVERLKRAARGTLKLARDLRDLKRKKFVFEMACHDLETQLSASKLLDKRIYVADERHSETERCFIARVTNPDYAIKVNAKLMRSALESWRHGRRVVIWAIDEKKAYDRLAARFPDHRGYRISELRLFDREF